MLTTAQCNEIIFVMNSVFYRLLISILSLVAFAQVSFSASTITPTLDDDDNPEVYTVGGFASPLVTEYGSGADTSNAIKVYIPVKITDNPNDHLDANKVAGNMVDADGGNLRFNLKITNGSGASGYLIGIFKLDGVWTIIYKGSVAASTNYDPYQASFEGNKLWTVIADLASVKDSYLYFFYTETNYALGDTIDDGSLPAGGIYYRTYLSGKLHVDPEYKPILDTAQKGDGRVFFKFRADLMPYAYRSAIISYPANTSTEYLYNDAISTGNGTILKDDHAACTGDEQEFTVNDLKNGQEYHLSVACMDKFQFYTLFPASVSATPQSIEAFLKENACYLVSAGFQRQHYVLDYFRQFRDQVLMQSSWGQDFTSWYYRTAPKYALMIVHNPVLSTLMRGMAYFLYFIFNFWKLLLIPVPLIIGLVFFMLPKWKRP